MAHPGPRGNVLGDDDDDDDDRLMAMMGLPSQFGAPTHTSQQESSTATPAKSKSKSKSGGLSFKITSKASASPPKVDTPVAGRRAGDIARETARKLYDETHTAPKKKKTNSIVKVAQVNHPLNNDDDEEEEEEEEEEDSDDPDALVDIAVDPNAVPKEHIVTIHGEGKPLTCMTIDTSGSRLVTAGREGVVRMYDFATMGVDYRPFKTFETVEASAVSSLEFNPSGSSFLLTTNVLPTPFVYDRDGKLVSTYAKGDPYIRDVRNTKGHTSSLTCSQWNPRVKIQFATASIDGTVRIWDASVTRTQRDVIVLKPAGGNVAGRSKVQATSIQFQPETGGTLAVGGNDGEIRVYTSKAPYSKPAIHIVNAHMQDTIITSLLISRDGNSLYSRGMDDCIKKFDLRNTRQPVEVSCCNSIDSLYDETNMVFSPTERFILAGNSVRKNAGPGSINVLNSGDLTVADRIELPGSFAINLLWQPKLNQLFASKANGDVNVLYDSQTSFRGVRIGVGKKRKAKRDDTYAKIDEKNLIITPNYQDNKPVSKKAVEPSQPKNISKKKMNNLDFKTLATPGLDDPRKAILKHAEDAKKNPYWVSPAYKDSPNKLEDKVYLSDREKLLDSKKKRKS